MILIDDIAKRLDELELHYIRSDKALHLRWQTEHFEDLRIKIVTNELETWLYIIARFSDFSDIPERFRYDFAVEMLQASWRYNGIKFAISQDNDVIVVAQTNDTEITKEELGALVEAVVNGCEVLWKISSSLGEGQTSQHNTDSKNHKEQEAE